MKWGGRGKVEVKEEVEKISASAFAECLIPASTDDAQQGRIYDTSSKRVDHCHVEGREAAYAADIDRQIEPVSSRCLN